MLTDKTSLVEGVLRAMTGGGWSLSPGAAAEAWHLSRNGQSLYVNANRHWLCLCQPLGTCPDDGNATDRAHLLRLCQRIFMAKYSLDSAGQLLLQVEIPLDGLDRTYCQRAIDAMEAYAKRFGVNTGLPSQVPEDSQSGPDTAEATPRSADSELVPMERLAVYFQSVAHLGWGLKDRTGANQWRAMYEGRERPFDGYISFCKNWVCLGVPVSVESQASGRSTGALTTLLITYALGLNNALFWAKVGLHDGQIFLTLDMPLEAFDLRRFRWACETLAVYADEYARDVQVVASLDQDRHLLEILKHTSAIRV